MAKNIKNQTPSEATTFNRSKPSISIVMLTKVVKKGKSKHAAKTEKIASVLSNRKLSSMSLLSKWQLSSLSQSFSSLSLTPSSSLALLLPPSLLSASASASASVPLPVTTAHSFSNETTPKKKKKNDAYLPPGLLSKLSLWLKADNFEVSSKIKLKHYEIDWFNPESFVLNVLKFWKEKNLSQSTMKVNFFILWRLLNRHKLSSHLRMQLSRLETQLPSYIIHCLGVKKR